MEREIEFRAWNKYHKKMFPVYMLNFESDLVYCKGEDYSGHTFGKIDCEIMQYTGLKDFFETKIFEGDIVFLDSEMRNYEIVIDVGAWKMKYKDQFENECYEWLCDYYEDLHVIGNIHQNAELLEQ